MDRRQSLKILGTAALAAGAWPALAQDRPIRIVLPYTAGGQTDTASRLIGAHMQKTLGRPVITENRPGGGALIATRYVQSAPPDGDTLLFYNWGFVTLPMLQKAATYDPLKDFDAVCMVGNGPNFLMVTDSVPAKTIPEFLDYARSLPHPIECANSGINTGGHIAAALLEKLANVKMLHVPYKGSSEVTTALITNQVKMQVSVTTDSLNPYIKAGKVRILGIATRKRSHLAPDVPTIGDFVPGYAVDGWYGILAPANTPLARRETLSAAFRAALADPEIKERLSLLYLEVAHAGPKEAAEEIADSAANFRNIVQVLGLTAQ